MMATRRGLTYADAGVSIAAGDALVRRIVPIAARTRVPGTLADIGGFSGLFDLKSRGYRHPVLVSSTDGVGTKLKIAFMTGIHDTVGIDLVAMSVNDILTQRAEPLFFLDYFVCGKLEVKIAEAVVRGVARGCREAQCALLGGETAEHPGDFPKGEYDLAGFVVGALEKQDLFDARSVVPGDILVGLPSSGLHSNGYSLVRKVLLEKAAMKLGARVRELGRTLGEELLEPTRIYVKAMLRLLRSSGIKGAAHITGGGIVGNLPRVLPRGVRALLERGSWPEPPVFDLIRRLGRVPQAEMDRTFNNGLGMILIVGRRSADAVIAALRNMGEAGYIVGEIRRGPRGATISA